MERQPQEILKDLQENNITVYSFSRLETINNCLYEAYRTYILDDRANQIPNCYSLLGGKIHDVLEQIMNNKASESDLLPAMNQELEDMNMLGIEFPKGKDGADTIRQGWIDDMTHFCKTYKAPKGKFETETFFLYETPKHNYIQGYIDLTRIRKDGSIDIYDYKTSTMYRGEDIKRHGRQLVLYALGKEQQGYKVRNIGWIFLKYCEVTYMGKKTSRSKEETEITKIIERKNLFKDLKSVIEEKLYKMGFNELDVDVITFFAQKNNEIPKQLIDSFNIKPCVIKYELSEETRQECDNYIDDTIQRWESLNADNEIEFIPKSFTKMTKAGKEVMDAFYDTNLCGYAKSCPHLQKFLDTWQKEDDDNDSGLF